MPQSLILLWYKWRSFLESIWPRLWACFVSQKEEKKKSSHPFFYKMPFSHKSLLKKHLCRGSPTIFLKMQLTSKAHCWKWRGVNLIPSAQNEAHNLLCTTRTFLTCAETLWHWCGFHPNLSWIITWPFSGQTGILLKGILSQES